ncbi:MAG TPA: ABC transporter substrate-binding protein [Candidatus Binatia bacterium]
MDAAMRPIRLAFIAGLFCLLATSARAAGPAEHLMPWLEQMRLLLSDPALMADGHERERENRIRDAGMAFLDVDETTRRVLRDHLGSLNAAQQKEFAQLFTVLLGRMTTPLPPHGDEWAKAALDRETIDGEFAVVEAHFILRVQRDVPMTYRLRLVDGKWKLYDWGALGTSFIVNSRAQVNKVMRLSSFDGLIKVMREQKEKIDKRWVEK